MKYKFEKVFDCEPQRLMEVMFSKGITERLKEDMTTLVEAETIQWEDKGDRIERKVRYLPIPMIKSIGPRKVEPKWMEWIEESVLYKDKMRVEYKNIPTTPGVAKKMENHGEMTFHLLPGGRTKRVISGELKVKVPILGRIAERVIASYAEKILEDEANALNRYIKATPRDIG